MYKYIIAVRGDNEQRHVETLRELCDKIEAGGDTVYRAWIEKVNDPQVLEQDRRVQVR